MTKTTANKKRRKQDVHYEVEISRAPPATRNNDTSGQYSDFVNSGPSPSPSPSSPPINPFLSTSFHRTMNGEDLSVSGRSGTADSARRDSACTLLEQMLTVDDQHSEEESIESLHAKACAYASTPIPYGRKNRHNQNKTRNSKNNDGFDDYLSFIESQVDTKRVNYAPVSSNVVRQQREATADHGGGMALSMATTESRNHDEIDGRGLDRTEALESALMGMDEYDDEYDRGEDDGVMDVALDDDTHHGRGEERGVNFRDYMEVVDFHTGPNPGPSSGLKARADRSVDYKPVRSKDYRGMAVSTKTRDNSNKIGKDASNENSPHQSILRGWNWDNELGRPTRSASLDSVRDLEGYLEAVESRQQSIPHDGHAAERGVVAVSSTKKGDDSSKDSAPRGSILSGWNWNVRLGRPKRRTSANQLYDLPNGSGEEGEVPDEDDAEYGIPAMFISSMQPKNNAREKKRNICFHYTHPMFHSKTFKVGIVWVVALCALLGAIVSIASSSRNRVNVEEEYLERVEGIEQLHGSLHHAAVMQPVQKKKDVEELDTLLLEEDAKNGNGYKIWNNSEGVVNKQGIPSDAKPDKKIAEKQNEGEETALSNDIVDSPMKEKESPKPAKPDSGKEPAQSQNANEVDAEALLVVLPTNEEPSTPTVPDDANNSEPTIQSQNAKADATSTNVPNNVPTSSVATTSPDDELTQEQHLAYHAMFLNHHPRKYVRGGDGGWKGQTYAEAYEFCQDVHHVMCPYEAICPMGPKSRPYEGYEGGGSGDDQESSSQWVPVSTVTNEWVNLSEENSCVDYSVVHNSLPDWGLTGEGNEGITRHVICCSAPAVPEETALESPTPPETGLSSIKPTPPSAASSITTVSESVTTVSEYDPAPYVDMFKKHHPRKFTRDEEGGWKGRTYAEAYEFCKAADHVMCPYEAFCPMGPNSRPYEGYGGDLGASQWVPVSDVTNEWVNLSEENSCVEYSAVYNSLPDWGLTGEGSEDITDHVMCCSTPVLPEETTLESPSSAITTVSEHDPASYVDMFKKHHPRKFTRGGDGGWDGRTYAEAYEFCKAADHGMCPYEAFCPMGPKSMPYEGYEGDLGASQWVPVSDVTNEWVNLSEQNSCVVYSAVYNALPDWGLTGEGIEDMTNHVMCCSTSVVPKTTLERPTPPPAGL